MATMVILWTLYLMLDCDVNFRDPVSVNVTEHLDGVLTIFKSEKWIRLWLSPPLGDVYLIFDSIVTLLILTDLIIGIIVCPYRMIFVKSAKLVAVTVVFLNVAVQIIGRPILFAKIEITSNMRYMFMVYVGIGILRPFLLIRLANAFVGLRVLIMVIAKSITELLTIVSFMTCGMMFFGVFIYLAELGIDGSFMSPWEGCWWTMITMSTVGYGDMFPHAWPGYFVGITCTFCGIIITGLSIPILSSNFNTYYNHVHMAMGEIRDHMKTNRN
jgi:hypothetical protein